LSLGFIRTIFANFYQPVVTISVIIKFPALVIKTGKVSGNKEYVNKNYAIMYQCWWYWVENFGL